MSDPGDRLRVSAAAVLVLLLAAPPADVGAGRTGGPFPDPPSFLQAAGPGPLADQRLFSGLHAFADTVLPRGATTPRGRKSPLTAIGLSALLPGAGQIYTENYWKVPLIWGLGGYWAYEWTRSHDRYREFRDLYAQSIASSPPFGDERYLRLREFHKDQRDAFAWYIGILYLLNVVDAYVGAELYDFDVGPDLGPGGGAGMQANLRIRF